MTNEKLDLAIKAQQIIPSNLPDFIEASEQMTQELKKMLEDTPVEAQALEAAKVFTKWGIL